jgi:hypothetical protein
MQTKNLKRYYTPQFSALASVSVRRLAWAMGKPMPAAVDRMVKLLPYIVDSSKVCHVCKDKAKCEGCAFHILELPAEEQLSILAAL